MGAYSSLVPFCAVQSLEEAVEICYAQNWTDGLPVVPPTREPIERMLDYLKRDPDELIGLIPPRNGMATVATVVVNCVMAGCLPEYVPVVIAAIEAMLSEPFNLNAVQTTTHSCAPLVIVSGPAVPLLGFNTKECSLGHGSRTDASIGRAVRLVLWNIGGGYPGNPCKTTFGHPGYYSYCMAEDQDANPWEPLHVERGFLREDTVVTVTGVEAPHTLGTGAGHVGAENVLYILADAIAVIGSCNSNGGGDMVLALGPMAARNLAKAGLSKLQVKQELMRLATRSISDMNRRPLTLPNRTSLEDVCDTDPVTGEKIFRYINAPENLVLVTAGGWGSGGGICSLCPGFGMYGGLSVSKKVIFPNA